jgi:hypothetical protein
VSLHPVLHSFAYGLDFLREQVADVPEAQMVAQPHGLLNLPAWVIGHLTLSCELLGGVVGLRPWLPAEYATLYGQGSRPVADPRAYEPRRDALARLAEGQALLVEVVAALDTASLDAPFPSPAYREVFPSVRHSLTQVLVGHTAHHVGQVGMWRKAMGLPPLKRGFE